MAHEVDLLQGVFRPEVDIQHEHGVFDFAGKRSVNIDRSQVSAHFPTPPSCCETRDRMDNTYLQSTSLPVARSITTIRTQGGGVMGRRSYKGAENCVSTSMKEC